MTKYQEIIKSILLNEATEYRQAVRDSGKSMVQSMAVMLMLLKEDSATALKKFPGTLAVIEEHGIKLPEEEAELEGIVKKIAEEGEGAQTSTMNVSAGIDSATPRIYPKGKKNVQTNP